MPEQAPLDLSRVFTLEPHGPDTYLAESPHYEWGRIYGGLVVAQALWAATQSVRVEHAVHSLHAYFILGGDFSEPVRYEVDRVRNGRSFSTRRVVARQSGGAILTLACSFQKEESGRETQSADIPSGLPEPGEKPYYDAGAIVCSIPRAGSSPGSLIWAKFPSELGDDPRLQACALAYLSDMNPMEAVVQSHPDAPFSEEERVESMGASLDHAIWFHRPAKADDWLLFDMSGHGMIHNKGLATGLVFMPDGTHVATIAQEGLYRRKTS